MTDTVSSETRRCGFVAIVGRPNVGKSTLLNHLLEQKISITSRKPQTTRHRITGVRTDADTQYIFVDTPGLHKADKKALNRAMNATVHEVLKDVDLVFFVVERLVFNDEDAMVLEALQNVKVPVLLLINKCDQLAQRERLLPHIQHLASLRDFAEIIPIAVLNGHNLDTVLECAQKYLPHSEFLFPEDQVTDRSSRFLASELIREKITRQLGDELPYEVTVEIERFEQQGAVLHIHGLILVDKPGQKQIIIGQGGERLRSIGKAARLDMERSFEHKVMLHLWVKVKSGWADDERALQSLN
ncbi:GTPase Era [Pseudohongiella sp. SYSU M77423]|uniref:GTPase Era n=1 Tax=unclassified Pseudohongiella TaxID=2629611 RepID=UPI001F0205CD|nr:MULTISPECIES: GTPase Era [unclassified Pseudohongiella]MDH7943063.1 GTPase Era [Pseudohongiella sp. SYSU M77423]